MAERGHELAAEIEAINRDVLAFLESIGDDEWGAPTPHERWSVGVTARHIAAIYPEAVELAQLIGDGQPLPLRTQADIDAANAAHARQHATDALAEVVDLLRRNGAAAADAVRGLSDEQLARSAPFFGLYSWTAEAVVEGLIVGHARNHLHSIQQAVEASRAHGQRRRAQRLAERLEAINDEVIAFVRGLGDAQWRAPTANERWTLGVAAHHVGAIYPEAVDLVQRVASGRPLPHRTQADIDAANEARAREHAAATPDEVAEMLRRNGIQAVAAVRRLSDEQLDRTALFFGSFPWSAEAIVEGLMIGHVRNHLRSMRQGIGAGGSA